jgi:hypothetical protein
MSFSSTFDPSAPAATTGQGAAVANREDLSDILNILAPEETPGTSMANRLKANSTFHEWGVDSLSAPSSSGVAEGSDVDTFDDKFANIQRLGNYVQKFRRSYKVSDFQEASNSIGPVNFVQAELKAMREVKRDVEQRVLSEGDRQQQTSGGSPYLMRGFGKWIDSAGPSDVAEEYRTDPAAVHAGQALTETNLNDMVTGIWRKSGTVQNLTLVADTAVRRTISDFARLDPSGGGANQSVRNVNYNGETGLIKLNVELYETHHGVISIMNMNPDCASDTTQKDTAFLLNPDYYHIAEFIPLGSTPIPNLGGGERGYCDVTLTLCCLHPGAFGKIASLSS